MRWVHTTTSIRYNPDDSDCEGLTITTPLNILIIGSGSAIARAVARRYAAKGCRLALTGRNRESLERQARDLRLRGAALAHPVLMDVNDENRILQDCIGEAEQQLGHFDIAVICHGTLPDQDAMAHDPAAVCQAITTNGLSSIRLLCILAPRFRSRGTGSLAVITSVAGDRGRSSNYIYGSAKALVSTYLSGLRAELHNEGVHVMDVRPGLVDTPMTGHLAKGPLWTTPDTVARRMENGITRRKDILYTPGFWRLIMWVIRHIPEPAFKRSGL